MGWFLGADLGLSAAGFFIMGGWGTSFEGANLNTRSSSSLGASCVGLLRDPSTSSVRARMVLSPKVSASNEVSRFSVPNSRMCLRRNASFWFHCRSSWGHVRGVLGGVCVGGGGVSWGACVGACVGEGGLAQGLGI